MLYCAVNEHQLTFIPVTDRGFSYGDGVFTTAKITNGKVEHLEAHIERLRHSCQRLQIAYDNFSALDKQLVFLAKAYPLAVLKVVITAGSGGRGYSRNGADQPNVIVSVFQYPQHYQQWQQTGISLGHSSIQLGINPLLAGIKHLNRLEQVLIRKELDTFSFDDVVVTDLNNNIIEASSGNLFWMIEKQWFTGELTNAGVAGIVREQLLQLSGNQQLSEIQVVKEPLEVLSNATSIFITNSVMGIVPVSCYQRQGLDIKPVLAIQDVYSSISTAC